MATWGEFIQDVNVMRMNPGGMVVKVDDVITIWDERKALRKEVAQLREALATEREACALEVEEFAQACIEESEDAEMAATLLRACAQLIRERESATDEVVPTAEAVPDEENP